MKEQSENRYAYISTLSTEEEFTRFKADVAQVTRSKGYTPLVSFRKGEGFSNVLTESHRKANRELAMNSELVVLFIDPEHKESIRMLYYLAGNAIELAKSEAEVVTFVLDSKANNDDHVYEVLDNLDENEENWTVIRIDDYEDWLGLEMYRRFLEYGPKYE